MILSRWRSVPRSRWRGEVANVVEGVGEGDPSMYGMPTENVLMQDPIESFGRDGTVPDPLWVDQEPGAAAADSEAKGFGAEDRGCGPLER